MPEIQDMSHRHEAIMRWMVANPHRKLSECARELGYTQAWLSVVVHSDIFQARLREMQNRFDDEALLDLRAKLTGIAHATADKLLSNLEFTDDVKQLTDTMDKTLNRLGYGTAKSVTVNNNNTQNNLNVQAVSPQVLQEARKMRAQLQSTIDTQELKQFPLPDVRVASVLVGETSLEVPNDLEKMLWGAADEQAPE